MLFLLLQQLLGPGKLPIGRKHGENLQTYQAGGVAPDRAANIRSRAYYDAAVAKGTRRAAQEQQPVPPPRLGGDQAA